MSIESKVGGAGVCRTLAGGLLALLVTGCGDFVSWNDRWMFDAGGDGASSHPNVETYPSCEADPIFGYHYPDPPELWLGSQASLDVGVSGAGFLVAGPAGAPAEGLRFARSGELFVAPDGTLSLGPDEPALGYAPGTAPGGSCLVELRAPVWSPPRPTTQVDLRINFDPRDIAQVIFDIVDPGGTATSSTSFIAFDSTGASHVIEVYFSSQPGTVEYYVVTDGRELAGGTPGTPTSFSVGMLQFTSDGALAMATTPALDVSFSGLATPNQIISLDFGPDIMNDGSSGYAGSTMFVAPMAVFSQSVDGHPAGTGTDIDIGATGDVRVRFDNGDALAIGTLALARFPREAALAPLDDGSWVSTSDSGAPRFGAPKAFGRGSLTTAR